MEFHPAGIDPTIAAFYERAAEEDRLAQGPFLLEALRTRELIERCAPAPPSTVIDIGGAAGAYALWLADAIPPVVRICGAWRGCSSPIPPSSP